MHVLTDGNVARSAADGEAVLKHFFASCNGLHGHFVPESDVVEKCNLVSLMQCYSLTGLKVTERHSHVVERIQAYQLHLFLFYHEFENVRIV